MKESRSLSLIEQKWSNLPQSAQRASLWENRFKKDVVRKILREIRCEKDVVRKTLWERRFKRDKNNFLFLICCCRTCVPFKLWILYSCVSFHSPSFFCFWRFLFAFVLYNKTYWNALRILTGIHTFDKTLIHSTKHKITKFGWPAPLYEGNTYKWRSILLHNHFICNIVHTIQKRHIETVKHKTITLVIWQTILYTFIN